MLMRIGHWEVDPAREEQHPPSVNLGLGAGMFKKGWTLSASKAMLNL